MWAKLGDDSSGHCHPLYCHLVDVAQVCLCLWNNVLKGPLKNRLSTALACEPEVAGKWIAFWIGAHDIGKASPGFQRRDVATMGRLKALDFNFPLTAEYPRHGVLTAKILRDLLTQPIAWPAISSALAGRIATTLGGHHGVFPLTRDWIGLGSAALGNQAWSRARQDILSALANALGIGDLPTPVPPAEDDHAFFMILAGLTSVADWIGSVEADFPFSGGDVDLDGYPDLARQRAVRALDSLGWTGWQGNVESGGFADLFGLHPRPLQERVVEQARRFQGPGLVLIEAPMGEGKTEAALFLSDHWIQAVDQQGVYVALPTQATSNQMFRRTKEFLAGRYPREKVNLHLLHGHALLSDDYRELRLAAIHDEAKAYDGAPGRVVAEEWFTPKKRGLLAPFAVGTIDQALLAVLQTRHAFVRLFGLANKTVILDEVHAYDAYMSVLLERLLEWLAALGSSVVLLSATLPKARRRQLLAAFGAREEEGNEVGYPRMLTVQKGQIAAVHLQPSRTTEISLCWINAAALAMELKQALTDGGCTAVICNTVGRAQEIYRTIRDALVPEGIEVNLFHARFPFGQRDDLEKECLRRFSKEGDRPKRAVLVATQVIEQSLDLDFDLMVTELAPVDLVLQRAGRLHRHERVRPPRLKGGQLWLLQPGSDDHGLPTFGPSEHVYERYILLRSHLALKGRACIQVPGDVEALIEAVYGEQTLPSLDLSWQAGLNDSLKKLEEKRAQDQWTAKQFLINSPMYPDDILEHFCQELEEDQPDLHPRLQALTRLSDPTTTVVCLHERAGKLYLDPQGAVPVDPDKEPPLEEARQLLRRSLSLSHFACVKHFLLQEIPTGWRRNPLLRHHRIAAFNTNGKVQAGEYTLRLDPILGAIVERTDSGGVEL